MGGQQPGFSREGFADLPGETIAHRRQAFAVGEWQATFRAVQPVGGEARSLGLGQPLAVFVVGRQAFRHEGKNKCYLCPAGGGRQRWGVIPVHVQRSFIRRG